jgi:hypothetical protein
MWVPEQNNRKKEIRSCSLTCSTLEVGGHARALRWDLDKLTKNVQDEVNLHNQENRAINAS